MQREAYVASLMFLSARKVLMKALSPGRRTAPGPERVNLSALALLPPVISSTPFSTVREELYRLSVISSGFLPKTAPCSSRRAPP